MHMTYKCEKCNWTGSFSGVCVKKIKSFGLIGFCSECGNIMLEKIQKGKGFYIIETDHSFCTRPMETIRWGIL